MRIPVSIKKLLTGEVVEAPRIEFKETWDPEASLKTICAFANDIDNWGGGYLVIGVTSGEDGRAASLKGVPSEKLDAWLKDILNKSKRIRPEYTPIVDVAEYKKKRFIVAWVPGGQLRPYTAPRSMAKADAKIRIPYIRRGASTITPSEEEERELYNLANNVPFDDRDNHRAQLSDLNPTLIHAYLKEIGSALYQDSFRMDFADLCRSMGIVSTLSEYTKPKNVGLMFFNPEPDRFFPYAQIDVVQFPDGLGGDRIIENTFKGPLHEQLRAALRYIRGSVIQEMGVKHLDRAEADRFFNYPYEAVEESLSNAVYHKGYDEREPIEVRVHPDRIEILSHPGADRSVTMEGLREFRVFNRRYRNRRIGDFLKELKLMEGRNTGLQKIRRALKANGLPEPVFETDENRTSFSTTIHIHPDFLSYHGSNGGTQISGSMLQDDETRSDVSESLLREDKAGAPEDKGSPGEDKAGAPEDKGLSDEDKANAPEDKGLSDEDKAGGPEDKGLSDEDKAGAPEDKGLSHENELGASEDKGSSYKEKGNLDLGNGQLSGQIEDSFGADASRKSNLTTQLLEILEENPHVTVRALTAELGVSKSSTERILRGLKAAGAVRREGSRGHGRWIVVSPANSSMQ